MITTREINVNLDKGRAKLKRRTTKDVDASIRVVKPKEPIKAQGVSTSNIADVEDIVEKKRRDEIAAGRKSFQKGDVVYQGEKGELVVKEKPKETLEKFAEKAGAKLVITNEEKKLAMKEKMAKVRMAKGKKK